MRNHATHPLAPHSRRGNRCLKLVKIILSKPFQLRCGTLHYSSSHLSPSLPNWALQLRKRDGVECGCLSFGCIPRMLRPVLEKFLFWVSLDLPALLYFFLQFCCGFLIEQHRIQNCYVFRDDIALPSTMLCYSLPLQCHSFIGN